MNYTEKIPIYPLSILILDISGIHHVICWMSVFLNRKYKVYVPHITLPLIHVGRTTTETSEFAYLRLCRLSLVRIPSIDGCSEESHSARRKCSWGAVGLSTVFIQMGLCTVEFARTKPLSFLTVELKSGNKKIPPLRLV